MSQQRIPVIASVDVLVIGSSTGAVTAALGACESGSRAYVVSDRSYFGEEVAGTLELWREETTEDPLLKSVLDRKGESVLRPGAIKHGLEKALLEKNIPFLFLTRPVALLRDRHGRIGGAVLASRTALYVVKAATIIDATRSGLVAQLAGGFARNDARTPELASLVVLTRSAAEGQSPGQTVGEPWTVALSGSDAAPLQAHRISLAIPSQGKTVAGLAAMEHLLRCQAVDPSIVFSAEAVALANEGGEGMTNDPLALPRDVLCMEEGLFVMGNLPLGKSGQSLLETSVVQAELGRKVGQWAAEERDVTIGKELAVYVGDNAGSDTTSFRFAESFFRNTVQWMDLAFPAVPLLGACDVAVAGGGTGGAPAGVSAARAGAKTVVLEMQRGLGGVGTLGTISAYWFGNKVGFTKEVDQAVADIDFGGEIRSNWNPETKMGWYHRSLRDAGGEAWFGSFPFGVKMEGNKVVGLLVSTPYGSGLLETGSVVDGTGNADIAAAAGAPTKVINGRHSAVQGTGLSARRPGEHYRNSDFTFVDDTDAAGVTHAFVNARAKFASEFDTIPMVDTRERRQIIGEIELSPLDFLADRRFPDTIVTAKSNFDTHGYTIHPIFTVMPPDKKPLYAHVPYRCLLPVGIEGVIVTGLGISAHRDALPVIRMQADVQNQGYAAGVAAAMAAISDGKLREINFAQFQSHLIDKEILPSDVRTWKDDFPLSAEKIKEAAVKGPIDLFHTAVLFAHPEQSIPLLLARLEPSVDPRERERAALVLGLMGCAEAFSNLVEIVRGEPWDEGWNFFAMGQFGKSMSRMDALIIALGKTKNPKAVEPIREKICSLQADAEFSHCRAVALASASLNDSSLSKALADLLRKPGMQGHSQTSTESVLLSVNDDPNENTARSLSLRELYLARGIYLSGDSDGLGSATLRTYAEDLRGQYARHAAALLGETDLELLRVEGS